MATEFGKILKKERIDRGWTLFDMAKALGISSAYLSHMETGRRQTSADVMEKLCSILNYHEVKAARLKKAASEAFKARAIKIDTTNLSDQDRDLAKMFARNFTNLDETQRNEMFKILSGDDEGDE